MVHARSEDKAPQLEGEIVLKIRVPSWAMRRRTVPKKLASGTWTRGICQSHGPPRPRRFRSRHAAGRRLPELLRALKNLVFARLPSTQKLTLPGYIPAAPAPRPLQIRSTNRFLKQTRWEQSRLDSTERTASKSLQLLVGTEVQRSFGASKAQGGGCIDSDAAQCLCL